MTEQVQTIECVNCGREYTVRNFERYAMDETCVYCGDGDAIAPDEFRTAMRDADGRPVFVRDGGEYSERYPRWSIVRRADGADVTQFKVYGFVGTDDDYEEAFAVYDTEDAALDAATGMYGAPASRFSMFDTDYGEVYEVEVHEIPAELEKPINIGDVFEWTDHPDLQDDLQGQRVIVRGMHISGDGEVQVSVNDGDYSGTATADDIFSRVRDGRLKRIV